MTSKELVCTLFLKCIGCLSAATVFVVPWNRSFNDYFVKPVNFDFTQNLVYPDSAITNSKVLRKQQTSHQVWNMTLPILRKEVDVYMYHVNWRDLDSGNQSGWRNTWSMILQSKLVTQVPEKVNQHWELYCLFCIANVTIINSFCTLHSVNLQLMSDYFHC